MAEESPPSAPAAAGSASTPTALSVALPAENAAASVAVAPVRGSSAATPALRAAVYLAVALSARLELAFRAPACLLKGLPILGGRWAVVVVAVLLLPSEVPELSLDGGR